MRRATLPTYFGARARSRSAGFTLVEVMIASVILAIVSAGVMTLFIAVLRFQSRTSAQVAASQSAALAVRHIMEDTREADYISLPVIPSLGLPDNGCFNNTTTSASGCSSESDLDLIGASGVSSASSRFTSYADSTFIATDSTGAYACQTALCLRLPTTNTTSKVNNLSQAAIAPVPSGNLLYARNVSPGGFLMFFRATAAGIPAPTNGPCLWEVGTDNGVAVDKVIVANIDTSAWNAVEFDRPLVSDGSGYINNEVQVKITCSQYSAVNKAQTDESTNGGNNTQLTGKCVDLRDFNTQSAINYNAPTSGLSVSAYAGGFNAS